MKVIHIIGQQGSGKTTLAADIIKALTHAGVSVGSIKHSTHAHELDKKGKDSFLHRKAGAAPAAMMAQDMVAVYFPRTKEMTPETLLETYYADLDFVIIESWVSGPYPKIEVIRPSISTDTFFNDTDNVVAIVSDDTLPDTIQEKAESQGVKILPRNNISAIKAYLIDEL